MDEQKPFEAGEIEEHELRDYEEAGEEEYHEVRADESIQAESEGQQDVEVSYQRGRSAVAERQRAQRVRKRARRKIRQVVQITEEEIQKERLRSYELLFLVDAAIDREEIDRTAAAIVQRIEQGGGHAENVRVSEARRLEYPIKRRTHGIYVLINFKAPPSVARELGTMLRFNENVLRHLLILTKHKTEPE